jgi:hypothetical protein
MGTLPDWVPNPLQREFEAIRSELLDKFKQKEVHAFLAARRALFNGTGFRSVMRTPPEVDAKLDALNYIRSIEELGAVEGIKAYLGERGLRVIREAFHDDTLRAKFNLPARELPRNVAQEEGLARGRALGAQSNKARGEEMRSLWAKTALDLWRLRPGMSREEVADYILNPTRTLALKPNRKPYSKATIVDALKGVRRGPQR